MCNARAAFLIAILFLASTSCTSILTTTVINPAVGNLQKQTDIDLVCEGAPAYLLMVDSLIESEPKNRDLLLLGTQSYVGMITALEACSAAPERLATLSLKAKSYGRRLIASYLPLENTLSPEFAANLDDIGREAASNLFWGSFGWLTWVRQQHGSPESLADLAVIESLMARALELDESVEMGSIHLFFGALYGAKPEMIGGDFQRSRQHFERALELSGRTFLVVQVTYAETYGRMTFNRQLHDTLLQEVLEFQIDQAPEHALANQVAKRRAQKLLDDDFFGD
jgi:hypothetical protein